MVANELTWNIRRGGLQKSIDHVMLSCTTPPKNDKRVNHHKTIAIPSIAP